MSTHDDGAQPESRPVATPIQEAELFPSLQRLQHSRKGRVPYVQQAEWTDCGPACLTMVLRYLGRDATLEEVREATGGGGRSGTDAASLIQGGEWYGLRGRGLSLDVEHLRFLPAGSILHWEFNHFVVFERMTSKGAQIVDPARGPRLIHVDELRRAFTGVALVYERTDAFKPLKAGSGRLGWYLSQLGAQRHVLSRVVVMSLLLRVFGLALPVMTAVIVDRAIPRGDYGMLLVIGSGLLGVLVFQTVSMLIRTHLLLQLRTNLDTRLTLGFVDYMSRLSIDFFQRRSTGDLMMRINNTANVREMLTSTTLSALLDGLFVLIYLALILWLSIDLGLIVLGLAVVQGLVFAFTRRHFRDAAARALDAQSRSQSYLVELFAGMSTLKAAAAEGRAVERWSNLYVDELNASLERGRLSARVEAIMGLITTGSPLVVLVLGALRVMDGSLTLGEMLAINAVAISLLAPLSSMVNSALQLQLLGGYMDRIDDVIAKKPEQVADAGRAPKLTGRVTLQNVSFRYDERAPFVVRDVSVDIRAGMKVALVGKSGSGKSTLASMIGAMHHPVEGRVLVDGNDVSRLELKSLRRQLGVVAQQPYLFASSIRANIALTDPSMTLDRVMTAARMACIHEDIEAMPMGYETLLADGGSSLSGGQRQRVAIARALVHRPAILILDEATSALDAETERRVMANLAQLKCTQIILAHRLSTIASADMILVMDRGEVVEVGTHKELVARGGYYHRLVAAQLTLEPGREVA